MTLSQQKYIESLAVKYNLVNARLYDTPMETNLKFGFINIAYLNFFNNIINEISNKIIG